MIEHIAVKGYRLFRDFETALQPGINVLIGANATGKSTLAEGFRIIRSCAEGPLPPGLEGRQAMGELFHPTADGVITCLVDLSVPDAAPHGNTRYTYAISIKGATPPVVCAEEIWRPRRTKTSDRIQQALVKDQEAALGDAAGIIPGQGQYRILRASAGTGELAERGKGMTWHLAPNEPLLSRATDGSYFPESSLVRNTILRWRFHTQIRVDRDSQQRIGCPIGGETALDNTAGNLLSVLLALQTNVKYREQWDELLGFLRTAVPQFQSLSLTPDPSGKYVLLQWSEEGVDATLSSSDLSDGVLRVLVLGAICCNPHPPTLICIDEPEIGLHPTVLPLVGGLLRCAARRSQVIVLTHSPDLLYGMPIESIAVMRREEGEARIVWPKDVELLCNLVSREVAGERELDPERLRQAYLSGELDSLG